VGDIVAVNEGMEVPADGVMFESNEVTIDESSMTGETNPVVKYTLDGCIRRSSVRGSEIADAHSNFSPVVMGGTRVLTGEGKMIIIVVGPDSCMGKIRAML
jgi:P-type E1-E2 ATPase